MSANPSYLPSRIAEAVTVARCGDVINQLTALEAEPSAKRYAASRQKRRELALDLVNEAQKVVDSLADGPVAKKRNPRIVVTGRDQNRKPVTETIPVVPATGNTITNAEVAAGQ